MHLVKRINNLPIELQDKIYCFYWSFYYSKFIGKYLTEWLHTMRLINQYIEKHAFKNLNTNLKAHHYYYKKYNNLLKSVFKQKSINRFLMNSPLCCDNIHYYNFIILNSEHVLKGIDIHFKFFCAYMLVHSANPIFNDVHQKQIMDHFKIISNIKVL